MLHLMRVVDRATGCIFAPAANIGAPLKCSGHEWSSIRSQTECLFAVHDYHRPLSGPRSEVRDVQDRWFDVEEYDASGRAQWRLLLPKPRRVLKGCHITGAT